MAGDISKWQVEQVLDVAPVTAGFPVRFCLLTEGDRQYVAYYDADHQMTVASRMLDSNEWQFQVLPSKVGWDSHNYITMAIDRAGQLHVSGNMHANPLVYFRTETAGDITTLKEAPMTGELETRTTYPKFLKNLNDDLIFTYRHGGSGNGINPYNIYDPKTQSWSRFLETPLFDGEGKINAYPFGPVRGPDGWFHSVWVWRDTPDCATNHDISYARSKNLTHWESAFGDPVTLPIKISQTELCVDPIPSHGGIINSAKFLFFDSNNRPVISYHKSDENGNMQVYAARPENGTWKVHQLTDWDKPVVFGGHGSMGFIGIKISGLSEAAPGTLTMTYRHRDFGTGRLLIDEETLKPSNEAIEVQPELPKELSQLESDFPGLGVQRMSDIGDSGNPEVRYVLKWETLGKNRDRKPETTVEPSMLKLYKLRTSD
ncbi:BNR repeat-containing protein [Pontiella desulfatans]|nr:BNR repeat-containing protein [Pontiella desulfatans]